MLVSSVIRLVCLNVSRALEESSPFSLMSLNASTASRVNSLLQVPEIVASAHLVSFPTFQEPLTVCCARLVFIKMTLDGRRASSVLCELLLPTLVSDNVVIAVLVDSQT